MNHVSYQPYCLNCEHPYSTAVEKEKEHFCPNCGQSSKDSRLSVFKLLKDGISNIFNLDSRLVHTFRDIISPSKLTRAYIEGRRKYYVNPARLFVFMAIVLIAILLNTIELSNVNFGVDDLYSKAEKSALLDKYNSFTDTLQSDSITINKIRNQLFKGTKSINNDSIGNIQGTFFGIEVDVKKYGISAYDAVHLKTDELYSKYKVEKFTDKLIVGQYTRLMTNPVGAVTYIIKNATWIILITIILMSLFIYVIYIRHKYYLIEHSVLLLNAHSLLFLLAIIVSLIYKFYFVSMEDHESFMKIINVLVITIFVVQFLTLKKYYHQGIFKTFLKQFMINVAYFVFFLVTAVMVTVISVILY